ncbi:MAG: phosphate ABC transporter permease subunit PstC, partial [Pseudomonadota bacterium]|nr:phosphate ABC transporter permease subunit PstC [Pseudomonadota bacterium]
AAWAGIPSFLLVLLWLLFQGPIVDVLLLRSLPPGTTDGLDGGQIDLLLSQIKSVAAGNIFTEPTETIREAADRYNRWQGIAVWTMFACAISVTLFGLAVARSRISGNFRARQGVERVMTWLMITCSVIAILTTLGIIVSLLIEALRFFDKASIINFFTGLRWEPQIAIREDQVTAGGAFGAVPVFAGTLLIAVIAMAVATPIGLYSAIYLTEYAKPRFRAVVKPMLEILAGIPTVVYGFFAVLTVAPAVRNFGEWLGIPVAPNSALVAGGVMGIMIIPFISSLSDDAIAAVPRSMRDGSYGLGATKGETIVKILLPAALPGIMGGVLLAVSRAIGETMIVVMAAGIIANLTANPLEPVTTVTVQIVTLLIGDTEFDNPKTLAAFALGLVLFLATLVLNIIALRIVRKYREQYE